MASSLSLSLALLLLIGAQICTSDEDTELEDGKKSFEDTLGDSMQGMNKWFQGMADGIKEQAEDGMDSFKDFSKQAKERSDDGVDVAKGWASGIGDSFSNAKDRMMETGEKMRETIGSAAVNTKEEIETAASKLAKHAKDAGDSMFKLFG